MTPAGPSERNSFLGRGLKREASEGSKNGSPGLAPGKIFHDHTL